MATHYKVQHSWHADDIIEDDFLCSLLGMLTLSKQNVKMDKIRHLIKDDTLQFYCHLVA